MGRFLANLHVHEPELDSAPAVQSLLDSIGQRMRVLGYRESLERDSAERRIQVARQLGGHWRTVLDSATTSQVPEVLDQSGEILSQASGRAVISFLVYDDDFLEMKLFRNGRPQATLHSWPGYFHGEPRSTPTGDFSAWSEVLPAHRSIDDFRHAWTPVEPVGGILPLIERVADVLEVDLESCLLSPDSLPAARTGQFATLALKRPTATGVEPFAAPSLGHAGGIAPVTKLRRGQAHTLSAIAHSTGRAHTGLRVLAWGAALDAGLVAVEGAVLTLGTEPKMELDLQDTPSSEGKLLIATRQDLRLPAGFTGPAEAFAIAEQDPVRGMELWLASRVSLDLDVRARTPGAGELNVALEPLEHREGLADWNTRIQVD